MKNTMLCGALLTLMCAQGYADTVPQTTPVQPATTDTTTPAAVVVPANTNPTVTTQPTTTQPAQNLQNGQQNPVVQTQPQPLTTTQPQAAVSVINCDYKIPTEMKTIDQTLVLTWSEKAAVQAFNFDFGSLDDQMQKLQACFTEQGWTGFNTALQKSGNLEAIKTQKLKVSSQLDGQPQVLESKDNQWKISLPLQVFYQNDKEKVTQLLNINLTIGRKLTGDLGITQMIATPRASANAPIVPDASTTTTTSAPTDAITPNTTDTGTPATNNTSTTPATINNSAPPATTNTNTPPATTNTGVPPANTNTNTPPATTNTGVPPANTNTNTPPATTNTGAPAGGATNTYTPPQSTTTANQQKPFTTY